MPQPVSTLGKVGNSRWTRPLQKKQFLSATSALSADGCTTRKTGCRKKGFRPVTDDKTCSDERATLDCDDVVVGIGVIPRFELARSAGCISRMGLPSTTCTEPMTRLSLRLGTPAHFPAHGLQNIIDSKAGRMRKRRPLLWRKIFLAC